MLKLSNKLINVALPSLFEFVKQELLYVRSENLLKILQISLSTKHLIPLLIICSLPIRASSAELIQPLPNADILVFHKGIGFVKAGTWYLNIDTNLSPKKDKEKLSEINRRFKEVCQSVKKYTATSGCNLHIKLLESKMAQLYQEICSTLNNEKSQYNSQEKSHISSISKKFGNSLKIHEEYTKQQIDYLHMLTQEIAHTEKRIDSFKLRMSAKASYDAISDFIVDLSWTYKSLYLVDVLSVEDYDRFYNDFLRNRNDSEKYLNGTFLFTLKNLFERNIEVIEGLVIIQLNIPLIYRHEFKILQVTPIPNMAEKSILKFQHKTIAVNQLEAKFFYPDQVELKEEIDGNLILFSTQFIGNTKKSKDFAVQLVFNISKEGLGCERVQLQI